MAPPRGREHHHHHVSAEEIAAKVHVPDDTVIEYDDENDAEKKTHRLITQHQDSVREEHSDRREPSAAFADAVSHMVSSNAVDDGRALPKRVAQKWCWFTVCMVHLRYADSALQQDYMEVTMVRPQNRASERLLALPLPLLPSFVSALAWTFLRFA